MNRTILAVFMLFLAAACPAAAPVGPNFGSFGELERSGQFIALSKDRVWTGSNEFVDVIVIQHKPSGIKYILVRTNNSVSVTRLEENKLNSPFKIE